MLISELRHRLERLRKQYGDLEVVLDASGGVLREEAVSVRKLTPLGDLCLPLENGEAARFLLFEG